MTQVSAPETMLADFLATAGLAAPGEEGEWTPLSGGVSSDIWRVTTRERVFCVKRALAQLKVAAEWKAPVGRNATEWAYMEVVTRISPRAVPRLIAQDAERGLFAMEWLAPETYLLWKTELLAGHADPAFAGATGRLLGRIHAATARNPALPRRFATDASFATLRIEPYFRATAQAHPDLAAILDEIADRTAATHKVLVHGDVSPKNILSGPAGPVLLDAECAWFGDPAFDLAFCLNHLAIKARVVTGARDALVASFNRLSAAYVKLVDWEPVIALEKRAAALLPALALARVDGKSPVEYLDDAGRGALRLAARAAMIARHDRLDAVRDILVDG